MRERQTDKDRQRERGWDGPYPGREQVQSIPLFQLHDRNQYGRIMKYWDISAIVFLRQLIPVTFGSLPFSQWLTLL